MITYKASDILKRAAQIADLENSSFISWNEQINLLNESYRKLYQTVINNNDKYYLKTVKVKELARGLSTPDNISRYVLPYDFYQLCAIRSGSSLISRKAASEPNSSRRYDIINEELFIYGGADEEDLELSYYPIPLTLSVPAPDRKLEYIEDVEILDCTNNGFLCFGENGVFVRNVAKGIDSAPVDLGIEYDDVLFGVLGRKYAVVVTAENIYYIDVIANTYNTLGDNTFKIAKKDCELYFFERQTNEEYTVYKESKYSGESFVRKYAENVKLTLPDSIVIGTPDVWTFTDNLEYVFIPYQATGEVIMHLWRCSADKAEKEVEISTRTKNTIINGDLYTVNYDICVNGAKIISDADFYEFIGFNKADGSTGYGTSVYNDDGELIVKSIYIDTELNFPNNFYFNYIAYMLAVAYKSKQNADPTLIIQQADAEELAFYDTLNRDANNVSRITNVYSGGGIW